MSFHKIAAGALFASAFAVSAHAVTISLPAATSFGGAKSYPNAGSYKGAQSVSYSDSYGDISSSVTMTGSDFSVKVAGKTNDQLTFNVADAYAKYYFVLLSAFPTDVHVLIDANAQAGGFTSYFAEAEVFITAQDGSLNQSLASARACKNISGCGGNNVFNSGGKTAVTLAANKIYGIQLDVNGHTGNTESAFSAWADPKIYFDPAYDMPEGLSFQFSSNLPQEALASLIDLSAFPVATDDGPGGIAGVPEPASWALMLVGFGGMGAMLRRRRALAAA